MNILLIALILAIFGFISIKKIEWGLYLIVLLLPAYLIRFNIGFIPFTLLEGMIIILVFAWIAKEIKNKTFLKSLKYIARCKFFLPTVLFFIAATVSVYISPDFLAASGIWKAYFLEPMLISAILYNEIKDKKQIKLIIWALSVSALVVSLVAIFQYVLDINIPDSYNFPDTKRATSIYGYPAAVGLFLGPILSLFVAILILKGKKVFKNSGKSEKLILNLDNIIKKDSESIYYKENWIILLIIIVLTTAIVLSKTEGAIIGVLAAAFFIFMFTKWRWHVLFGSLSGFILVLLIPQAREYFITLITFQDVSGDVRLVLWEGTWRLIKDNPIFGSGLAGFPVLYEKYKEAKHVELSLYPHNVIFNFWAETGILGLLSFIWIVVLYFWSGFKIFVKKLDFYSPISLALISVMVSILVYGLVDVPYFKNDLSCLFWIFIVIMASIKNINK